MNCTRTDANGQLSFPAFTGSFLMVPSSMTNFYDTKTTVEDYQVRPYCLPL